MPSRLDGFQKIRAKLAGKTKQKIEKTNNKKETEKQNAHVYTVSNI